MNVERFELVLKGGRVLDPSQELDAKRDVGISAGRIAAIEPDIAAARAVRVVDVAGALVTPGLIDLHVHVYRHFTDFGLPPDDAGVNAGVTTVVDQGSAGAWTFDGFKAYAVDPSATDVRAFLSVNLSGTLRGCRGGPVIQNPDYIDLDVMQRFIEKFPEVIRGVKAHSDSASWSLWGSVMLRRAREIADRTGLPMYVHTGELWKTDEKHRPEPRSVMEETLFFVRPGDTLAHCYSSRDDGVLGRDRKPSARLVEAVKSGVHLDIGHGVNFCFDTARRMMDAGLYPHTISTDVHGDFFTHDNDTTLDYSMVGTMSKLLALGFDLPFVVRASTQHPAKVLRVSGEIGTLRPGARADVSVLDLVEEPWTFTDCNKEVLNAGRRIVPRLVVRAGRTITPTNRLLRDVVRARDLQAA
jgi:dihydroorotase